MDEQVQLNVRVTPEIRRRLEVLAESQGATLSGILERVVDIAWDLTTHMHHGFLNEAEELQALAALEGFQRAPLPGLAIDFIQRFGYRLLETARAWACVVDGRCKDPRKAPLPPWLKGA